MSRTDFSPARWRKSSHSSQEGDQCVELADVGAVIGIRDSKNPSGPILELSRPAFAALLEAVRKTA